MLIEIDENICEIKLYLGTLYSQTSTYAGVVVVPTLSKIASNGQIWEFTASR